MGMYAGEYITGTELHKHLCW